MARKTLYLIDGHAQIYRAYYAPFGALTSPKGEPTRATHVFTQMVLNLLRDKKPDYVVMVMDTADETVFRTALDPTYKANRQASPEDLAPQIERIVRILESIGMPILRIAGFEADDILATLAHRLRDEDIDIFLVSRDKDLDQLVTDRVRMYDPAKDRVLDAAAILEEKGYGPRLAVEAQMLMGDSTDNVIGVVGVGPKKAAQLLQQYGSVAGIIAAADKLTPKLKENVLAFAPRQDLVRQLVTLRNDVPIEFDLAKADVKALKLAGAKPHFVELGFTRLIDQLNKGIELLCGNPSETVNEVKTMVDSRAGKLPVAPKSRSPQSVTTTTDDAEQDVDLNRTQERDSADSLAADGQLGLFDQVADITERRGDYKLVDSEEALADLAKHLSKCKAFAFDTETTGLTPADADLVGISMSDEAGKGWYVAVRGVGKTLPEDTVRKALGPIFANASIKKCGQNCKFDIAVLKTFGLTVAGVDFDSMIASFVQNSMRRSHGLDQLSLELLQYRPIPTEALIGKGKNQTTFDKLPTDRVCEYAAEDADVAWQLCEELGKRMTEPELAKLFREVEMPLVEVLADMELRGVAVDVALLSRLSTQMGERMTALRDEIHHIAGRAFNVDSTRQLAEVLFDERKLRVVKKTQTGRSTDADVLEQLAAESDDPIPKLVIEYREMAKLRGTYVDALPTMISKKTGRIHPSFHQTGAVTGRLSCSDPNLQNIPIRTEAGAQIRRAFVPGFKDHVLIKADYSQIELRVLAHFCGDEALAAAFRDDRDIHQFVASQIEGVPLEAVTKEQRAGAKTVNFGIVYGQSAFGLSRQTGMSVTEAKIFIAKYFDRYPKIRGFLDSCVEHARTHGYVKTIMGRRRAIPDIHSRNQTARNAAERFAVNTVVQGSAADLIKLAMIRIDRRIRAEKRPSKMLLQVHDELVFETPRESIAQEAAMIREEMSQALKLTVPIKVDVASGMNWLDMQAVK